MRWLKGGYMALLAATLAPLIAACSADGSPVGESGTALGQTLTSTASPAPTQTRPTEPTLEPYPTVAAYPRTLDEITVVGEHNVSDFPCTTYHGEIPGFGGFLLDSKGGTSEERDSFYVYLVDPHERKALEAAACVFGHQMVSFKVLKAQYTIYELNRWYDQMRDYIWSVPALSSTGVDGSLNRISLDFVPRKNALKDLYEAVEASGVPKDAVIIEAGCKSDHWFVGPRYSPISPQPLSEELRQALKFELNVPVSVAYGATVPLTLKATNVSDKSVTLELGGGAANFTVEAPDGIQVWSWLCGGFVEDIASHKELAPGESMEFKGQWEQVDYGSAPVYPGTYSVHSTLNVGGVVKDGYYLGQQRAEAGPVPFTILPRTKRHVCAGVAMLYF